ncbi:MAG: hypothetical protein KDA87_08505 [Planctomycetales bacterium]|nr:hypothetical protein [Planctomycetales bacterium]
MIRPFVYCGAILFASATSGFAEESLNAIEKRYRNERLKLVAGEFNAEVVTTIRKKGTELLKTNATHTVAFDDSKKTYWVDSDAEWTPGFGTLDPRDNRVVRKTCYTPTVNVFFSNISSRRLQIFPNTERLPQGFTAIGYFDIRGIGLVDPFTHFTGESFDEMATFEIPRPFIGVHQERNGVIRLEWRGTPAPDFSDLMEIWLDTTKGYALIRREVSIIAEGKKHLDLETVVDWEIEQDVPVPVSANFIRRDRASEKEYEYNWSIKWKSIGSATIETDWNKWNLPPGTGFYDRQGKIPIRIDPKRGTATPVPLIVRPPNVEQDDSAGQ